MGDKDGKIRITVCTGDGCSGNGSKKVCKGLKKQVEKRGLGKAVKVKTTSCLKSCKHGPVVVASGVSKRYTGVVPDQAGEILDDLTAFAGK